MEPGQVAELAKVRDFALEETGGGCTAYVRRRIRRDCYIIAAGSQGHAPVTLSEPVELVIEKDDEPEAVVMGFENIGACLGRFKMHEQDEDCAGFVINGECVVCCVSHCEPCRLCGGAGFHKPSCPEYERT